MVLTGTTIQASGNPLGINGIILTSSIIFEVRREDGWVVTKIESRRVKESQFEVPAGYVRKQPP